MNPPRYRRVDVERDADGVATATMRPVAAGPIFDEALLDDLLALTEHVAADRGVRVLVLTGAGATFSSGGDVQWLRRMRDADLDSNVALSLRLERLYRGLDRLPQPVVGRVAGDAIAAGTGLVATCDVVVAVRGARFGFGDAQLGLAPAVVAPYVVAKVGQSFARAVFLTGERFDATRALAAGLVHEVVEPADLDRTVAGVVAALLRGAPTALAAAKRLPARVAGRDPADVAEAGARLVSELRASPEGQEGTTALLERRPPRWAPEGGGR